MEACGSHIIVFIAAVHELGNTAFFRRCHTDNWYVKLPFPLIYYFSAMHAAVYMTQLRLQPVLLFFSCFYRCAGVLQIFLGDIAGASGSASVMSMWKHV